MTDREPVQVTDELRQFTATLCLSDALQDESRETGADYAELIDTYIESGVYDLLYDYGNGLWGDGPDYLRWFRDEVSKARRVCE
jgi:hypothetical protein